MRPRLRSDGQPLHVKYRPTSFDEVIGQDSVVASLRRLLGSRRLPHAYLFTGPSGCGKTSLARLLAEAVGCERINVAEFDAASYSGVNETRALVNDARYRAIGVGRKKAYIIDEAHALSSKAWDVLLMPIEEPLPHAYWMFCTTEAGEVPKTIKTRCHDYHVRGVSLAVMEHWLADIAVRERLPCDPAIVNLCARAAAGSPRQALINLSKVVGTPLSDARALLASEPASNSQARRTDITDVVKLVKKGQTRTQIMDALSISRTTLYRRIEDARTNGQLDESEIKRIRA